jgi:hypothetical protein
MADNVQLEKGNVETTASTYPADIIIVSFLLHVLAIHGIQTESF